MGTFKNKLLLICHSLPDPETMNVISNSCASPSLGPQPIDLQQNKENELVDRKPSGSKKKHVGFKDEAVIEIVEVVEEPNNDKKGNQYDLRIAAPHNDTTETIQYKNNHRLSPAPNTTPASNADYRGTLETETIINKNSPETPHTLLQSENSPKNSPIPAHTPDSHTKSTQIQNKALEFELNQPSHDQPLPEEIENSLPMLDGVGTSNTMASKGAIQRSPHSMHGAGGSGQSMEFTQNHSVFEMSIQTEIDLDGKKQEEYNKHLAQNQALPGATQFRHYSSVHHDQTNKNTVINKTAGDTMDVMVINEIEEIDAMRRKRSHLDTNQLFVQLTLLKKFGFNVENIKRSIM